MLFIAAGVNGNDCGERLFFFRNEGDRADISLKSRLENAPVRDDSGFGMPAFAVDMTAENRLDRTLLRHDKFDKLPGGFLHLFAAAPGTAPGKFRGVGSTERHMHQQNDRFPLGAEEFKSFQHLRRDAVNRFVNADNHKFSELNICEIRMSVYGTGDFFLF